MTVVADSSPLIVLAKTGHFDLIPKIYSPLYITEQVYAETVVSGAHLPGAAEVANAPWIEVKRLRSQDGLAEAAADLRLGLGEMSTIWLAKEVKSEIVLLDDLRARRVAKQEGLAVRGTVGMIELLYRKGFLSDIREAFAALLANHARIDREILQERLRDLNFPSL